MTPEFWLQLILVGGLSGAVGQSARVIVGLKKLNDEADSKSTPLSQLIDPTRLIVSLLIGFVAGVLAAVVMHDSKNSNLDASTILAFAAAGYTGADFIEGVMSRFLPSGAQASNSNPGKQSVTAADSSSGAYQG